MKWSMDTHKYMSEITRKALQIMVDHEITSESELGEIDAVERELGLCGVYKDYESAKGRVKRALFTYFKAYGCLDHSEHLTDLGRLYVNNKITLQEFSFYYILNYVYERGHVKCYPAELALCCFYKLYEKGEQEAYLSAYDFSRIVECDSVDELDEAFIDGLLAVRGGSPIAVNERNIGFDVWANMFVQAGIFKRNADRHLLSDNIPLIKWILESYQKQFETHMGTVCTGILNNFPIVALNRTIGESGKYANEGKALHAFLFDAVEEDIINKYIMQQPHNNFTEMCESLGVAEHNKGFFKEFAGLERLIGYCTKSLARRLAPVTMFPLLLLK